MHFLCILNCVPIKGSCQNQIVNQINIKLRTFRGLPLPVSLMTASVSLDFISSLLMLLFSIICLEIYLLTPPLYIPSTDTPASIGLLSLLSKLFPRSHVDVDFVLGLCFDYTEVNSFYVQITSNIKFNRCCWPEQVLFEMMFCSLTSIVSSHTQLPL